MQMKQGYNTSTLVDYFTKDGLIKKTGQSECNWWLVIIKELIDNALDAIETLEKKEVTVEIDTNRQSVGIFDNGTGIPREAIANNIYDFTNYYSRNRHFITPSRGKQGNGLKTIISICYLEGYQLLWHTEGKIIQIDIDATDAEIGIVNTNVTEVGNTDKNGIEITRFTDLRWYIWQEYIHRYAICNPDVTFHFLKNGIDTWLEARAEVRDKSNDICISYYDLHTFKRLLCDTQDGHNTYKNFLQEYFGTRVKNASVIKSKIKDIDFESEEFINDFEVLRQCQSSKKKTMLKNHLIGLKYNVCLDDPMDDNIYYIEFDVRKNEDKEDKSGDTRCECYINNSISYDDSRSISFKLGEYKLGGRTVNKSYDFQTMFSKYSDYSFVFHFIAPKFKFLDAGKTEIDISGIIDRLVVEIKKAMAKEKKIYDSLREKPIKNTDLLRPYVDKAFAIASSNGKYSITARQMWYKLRELSGADEKLYSTFTQTVVTEWLAKHPEYEDKVNFANRGVFYIGENQTGLGTANVRNFLNKIDAPSNLFQCYGGFSDDVFVKDDFNISYKFDKVLYIEKTGFDDIFKAEKIGEKYNMIIVSGQGFPTRAAKEILYEFQKRGFKLYCMHDLDISGIHILNSFENSNDKFEHKIYIHDLGVTIKDVEKYGIVPELVKKSTSSNGNMEDKLSSLPYEYQKFFDAGNEYRRVELNAFTTEQLLEILEEKLAGIDNIPRINLADSFEVDEEKLKEVALMRVLKRKYLPQLQGIRWNYDLSEYDGTLTVKEAQKMIPEITDNLISDLEELIEQKLNILKSA